MKEYGYGNVYMGSKVFQPTKSGYAQAYSEIKRIENAGHVAECNRYDDVMSHRW